MKILLVHTYYRFSGGEDAVFAQEASLLRQTEDVQTFTFRNKTGIRGILQFILSGYNIFAARKLKKYFQQRPDIIHIHNWHYAIGPIIIRKAKKAGIPVVLTLHNYRLLCPSATLFHNNRLFTYSLEAAFPWKAVRNKIYRQSAFQTFWLAFVVWYHKKIGTWKSVDQFIALTEFSKQIHLRSTLGIDAPKIIVKQNFTYKIEKNPTERNECFVFIGRLSEEKGIDVLLEAFKNSNYNLLIAGDGPLKEKVIKAGSHYPNIKYAGSLDKQNVAEVLNKCAALLFPSIWYETFGLVIIEAFSYGCPVLASDIGSPTELIQDGINGFHFQAGNATSLKEKLDQWHSLSEVEKIKLRNNAIDSYNRLYTSQKNKELLINIYKNVLKKKSSESNLLPELQF